MSYLEEVQKALNELAAKDKDKTMTNDGFNADGPYSPFHSAAVAEIDSLASLAEGIERTYLHNSEARTEVKSVVVKFDSRGGAYISATTKRSRYINSRGRE